MKFRNNNIEVNGQERILKSKASHTCGVNIVLSKFVISSLTKNDNDAMFHNCRLNNTALL